MGCNLKDTVGRGVDDGLAGPNMLLAQLLDDLGAGRWKVTEDLPADGLAEGLDDLGRKTAGVGGEGFTDPHSHHLPVAGRGVFSLRALGHLSEGALRMSRPSQSGYLIHHPQSQLRKIRKLKSSNRTSHVL